MPPAAVHVSLRSGLPDHLPVSDEFFDLLPGESRRITVRLDGGPVDPATVRAGHAGQPVPSPLAEVETRR